MLNISGFVEIVGYVKLIVITYKINLSDVI